MQRQDDFLANDLHGDLIKRPNVLFQPHFGNYTNRSNRSNPIQGNPDGAFSGFE
jgi:hypothetical protein